MGSRVTQREVAAAAGVSLATVSRVYSGHAGIPEDTRERVRNIGVSLGYLPTPGLSAAMSARWSRDKNHSYSRIAVVRTEDPEQKRFFDAVVVRGEKLFERQALDRGFGLEIVDIAGSDPRKLRRHLEFLRIDGVMIPMVPSISHECLEVLCYWPCVGLMAKTLLPGVPVVGQDELMNSWEVFERVIQLGYRRTGVILTPYAPSPGVTARIGGLMSAREQHGNVERLPFLYCGDADILKTSKYLRDHACDSVIMESDNRLKSLEKFDTTVKHLGRAALIVGENNAVTSGIKNNPLLLHERVLGLLNTMIRGSVRGSQFQDLRETVNFSWQDGFTLPKNLKNDSTLRN